MKHIFYVLSLFALCYVRWANVSTNHQHCLVVTAHCLQFCSQTPCYNCHTHVQIILLKAPYHVAQ